MYIEPSDAYRSTALELSDFCTGDAENCACECDGALQMEGTLQSGAASSTVAQSVTTLLKAVSPAASVSTVTIPVSAVGISVAHPKLVAGMLAQSFTRYLGMGDHWHLAIFYGNGTNSCARHPLKCEEN